MEKECAYPIHKNKGDAQCYGSYRGIKLMSHTMKILERIIEARLRDRVEISKQKYGFMPGKKTTDAMFALRMLIEKYLIFYVSVSQSSFVSTQIFIRNRKQSFGDPIFCRLYFNNKR